MRSKLPFHGLVARKCKFAESFLFPSPRLCGRMRAAMTHSGKLHALLCTARIANVPSVVSNVWLGFAISAVPFGGGNLSAAAPLAWIGVFIYLSGNFLNDWMDRAWDVKHRPERALPSGIFGPSLYISIAISCMAAGLLIASTIGTAVATTAGSIIAAVVIYTIWHKRSPWAVVPMGLCRALLPILGAAGNFQQSPWLIAASAALFCHIAGLSLSARYESMSSPPASISWLSRALFAFAVCSLGWNTSRMLTGTFGSIPGVLPYVIWICLCLSIWRKPVPLHVSQLLAGIPLVDLMALLPIALSGPLGSPFHLFCLAIPVSAFFLALLLQRVAPAT